MARLSTRIREQPQASVPVAKPPQSSIRVTINDIARHAGVSKTAVFVA